MGMNFDVSVEHSIQEIVDYFRLPVSIRKADWNPNEYFTIERIEKNEARGTFYRNGQIKKKLFGSYHYSLSDSAYITGKAYDEEGYDLDGYDEHGYDRKGYDKDGYNCDGYDQEGYDRNGVGRDGFNKAGIDKDGFNRKGLDAEGYNREGFNSNGLDRDGFNRKGFNKYGYDREGFNCLGFDKDGFGRDGFNQRGIDRDGYNRQGYNAAGFNRAGYNKDGFDKYGYDKNLKDWHGKTLHMFWLESIDCCPHCHEVIAGNKSNKCVRQNGSELRHTIYVCYECKIGYLQYSSEEAARNLFFRVSCKELDKANPIFRKLQEEQNAELRKLREKKEQERREKAESERRKREEEQRRREEQLAEERRVAEENRKRKEAERYTKYYEKYDLGQDAMSVLLHIPDDIIDYLREHYTHGSLPEEGLSNDESVTDTDKAAFKIYFDKKYRENIVKERGITLHPGNFNYYLYDYYPARCHKYIPYEKASIANRIWLYKDGDSLEFGRFTEDLSAAITLLCDDPCYNKYKYFSLMAIPSSSTLKRNPIINSISKIVQESWTDKRRFNKYLLDVGSAFERISSLPSAHKGSRPDYYTQKKSICFHGSEYITDQTFYIIMDDILTTGTQYAACREILVSNGVPRKDIIALTIGRTVP